MAKTTRKTPGRKKRTTVPEAERAVYSELLESLSDYHGETPFSQVLLKFCVLLPAETFVLLRLAGYSYNQIANEVNLSKFAVYKLATFYKSMDPPFGGFEPLQINYLKKQLEAGRTLGEIAEDVNTALDKLEGVLPEGPEDTEVISGPAPSPGTQSDFQTWFMSSESNEPPRALPGADTPSIEPNSTANSNGQTAEPRGTSADQSEAAPSDDIWGKHISSSESDIAIPDSQNARDLNVIVQTFDSFDSFTSKSKDTDGAGDAGLPEVPADSGTPAAPEVLPKAAEPVTIRFTEQGLKYYMDDYGIKAVPEKSLAKIIEFRQQGKDLRKRETNNMYLWKNLAAYYQESEITLKGYIHQQVFPPNLVALYRLSGYTFARIVNTVPKKEQELLGLTGTRLAIVQKTSYRKNPQYQVIPLADLLKMLPNGVDAENISDEDLERITRKYAKALSAPKAEIAPKSNRKKIFHAQLTAKGVANYIEDITQPSASKRKRAKKEDN